MNASLAKPRKETSKRLTPLAATTKATSRRYMQSVSPTIDPVGEAEAFVLFTAPVLVELDSTGERVGSIPEAMKAHARFELEWHSDSWKVTRIVAEETS